MGEIARARRAERFIEEFLRTIVPQLEIQKGDEFVVTDVGLEFRRYEQDVVPYVELEQRGVMVTQKHVVYLPYIVFDPETDQEEDMVTRLRENWGVSDAEAKARLGAARLI